MDKLLWHGSGHSTGPLSAATSRLLKLAIAYAMRNTVVEVRDVVVQYEQLGQPGPSMSTTSEWQDAVRVGVRSAMLARALPDAGSTGASEAAPAEGAAATMHYLRHVLFSKGTGDEHNQIVEATKLAVAGVQIDLLSRLQPAPGMSYNDQLNHEAAIATTSSRMLRVKGPGSGLRKRRPAARSSPSPAPETEAEVAAPQQAWDTTLCILQQWGLEVVVSLAHSAHPFHHDHHRHQQEPTSTKRQLALQLLANYSRLGPIEEGSVPSDDTCRISRHNLSVSGADGNAGHLSAASSQAAAGSAVASPPRRHWLGLHLHVDATLKSIVPELSPDAALVGLRLADRFLMYSKYSAFWLCRPSESVKQAPVVWWQHAVRAVIDDCRARYPLRKMSQMLELRKQYLMLYNSLHSKHPHYIHTVKEKKKRQVEDGEWL